MVTTKTLKVEKLSQQLVVSIPREPVSVLGVSVDLDVYLQSPVCTTELLLSRLLRLSSLPQGEILDQSLFFFFLAHIFVSYSCDMLCVPL